LSEDLEMTDVSLLLFHNCLVEDDDGKILDYFENLLKIT